MGDVFTDSEDEKAVEDLLSQAMDSIVLEQVSAINCAAFSNSGGLPSHLQTRFQNLKSTSLSSNTHPPTEFTAKHPGLISQEKMNTEKVPSMCSTKSPEEKSCLSDTGSGSLSPFNKIPQRKKGAKKSPSFSSSEGSVSPPVKVGCFLCSPNKKVKESRKKNKENRGLDDEFLSDVRSQRKMIKKAMEEEEKICREAEKIVKWASARMDVSYDELLSDDEENTKFH